MSIFHIFIICISFITWKLTLLQNKSIKFDKNYSSWTTYPFHQVILPGVSQKVLAATFWVLTLDMEIIKPHHPQPLGPIHSLLNLYHHHLHPVEVLQQLLLFSLCMPPSNNNIHIYLQRIIITFNTSIK